MPGKYECICDTSVLNHLIKHRPNFHTTIQLYIPENWHQRKETRQNKPLAKLVLNEKVSVLPLNKRDKQRVEGMIREVFGSGIANQYKHGRMKHEAVEYECAYISQRNNIPVYYYDNAAERNCHKLLRHTDKQHLIKSIDDFLLEAPIQNKREFALHFYTQGYDLRDDVKTKFKIR